MSSTDKVQQAAVRAAEKAKKAAETAAANRQAARKALDEFILQAFKDQGYSSYSYVEGIILNTLLDGRANSYQRVNTYLVSLYRDRPKIDVALTQVFARIGRSDEVPVAEVTA